MMRVAVLALAIAVPGVAQEETGRVQLEFVTQSGRPWVATGMVVVDGREVRVTRGRAALDEVAVGASLDVLATGPLWVCATGIAGPDRAGATVRRRVAHHLRRPFLDVRLHDPSGKPLADGDTVVVQRVVREDGRRARGGRDRVPVAGGGRVAFAIAPQWRLLALRFVAMRGDRAIGAVEVAVDRPFTNDVHALDDVRLGAATCLVRGRLTGGSLPLRHPAWVELHPARADEVELRDRQAEAIPPFVSVSWNPYLVRRGAYGASVDREGRFAIHGIPTDAPFVLRVCSRAFPTVERRAESGAVVDVPVECYAVVRGTITPPRGIPADRFYVVALVDGERVDVGFVGRDRGYSCDRLPRRVSTTLRVMLYAGPGYEHAVAERQVSPSRETGRAVDFDVRDAVPVYIVRVVGPDGAPLAGASIAGAGYHTETDASGVAVVPRIAASTIMVARTGFVGTRLPHGIAGPSVIRLERTPRR